MCQNWPRIYAYISMSEQTRDARCVNVSSRHLARRYRSSDCESCRQQRGRPQNSYYSHSTVQLGRCHYWCTDLPLCTEVALWT